MNTLEHMLIWKNFRFCVAFYVHNADYGPAQRHLHDDFFELVFVRSGSAFHNLDGKELKIGAGSVFIVHPGHVHFYKNANNLEIYNILFAPDFLRHFEDDIRDLPVYQMLFNLNVSGERWNVFQLDRSCFDSAAALLDDILAEEDRRAAGARTAVLADFCKVMLLFCRNCRPDDSGAFRAPPNAYRIGVLMAALESRCAERWTLNSMAACSKMSESSFRQRFREFTGTAPVSFLINARLRKAAAMLARGESDVSGTAAACGFPDSNYFSRLFRRKYGMSPRRFRQEARP